MPKKLTLTDIKVLTIQSGLNMSELAKKVGYSRTHLYDAIREPSKYPELYQKILDTCQDK
jgi:DNA-binding phage protein